MGIRTVIILSILAMAMGLMFLFIWIDQRRQQKRLRAIARYNRERQLQQRQETKGPRVVEVGNKRVIIDPLVAGFDDEFFDDEPAIVEVETMKAKYQDLLEETDLDESNVEILSAPRVVSYSAPTFNKEIQTPSFTAAKVSTPITSAQSTPIKIAEPELPPLPDYLTISLMAENGQTFGGYDLLQSILGAGLRHGERQIFHYYDAEDPTKILFSLASIAKPGTFSLESMGSFSTPGLIFIFEIERSPELLNSFELLIETASQLRDELDGSLLDDRREPLTTERIQTLRQQLRQITPGQNYFDEN